MYMKNWLRKGIALLLAMMTLTSILPLGALAESFSAVVTASETRVYQNPSMTGVYVLAPKGTVMTVKGTKGDIAQVSRNGYIGYVDLDDLEAASNEDDDAQAGTVVTLKSPLTVYAKASESAKKAVTPAGEQITVLDEGANGWVKLMRGSYVGYAKKAAIEAALQSPTAAPTATPVPTAEPTAEPENDPIPAVVTKKAAVYATANANAALLGHVYKGEQVNVLDVEGDWALIDKGGNRGYMLKEALQKLDAATPVPTATPTAAPTAEPENDPIPCTVTANTVVVYAKASTSSTVLGRLKKGETVDVVDVKGNWALVDKDGHRGYALKGGLTPTSELEDTPVQTPAVKFTATVISDTMPIYASASTKADKVISVSLGATVNVHEGGSKWALVSYDGKVGYAQIAHMSARSHDTYESGDSSAGVQALNEQLLKLGYYDAIPGKTYNAATVSAVKRLQGEIGVTQSGKADITLMRVLIESADVPASPLLNATLSSGSKGDDVERIQTRLLALGYLSKSGSVDASFGSTTQNAVKLFQKAAGITQSGKADSSTIKKLYSASAPTLPSGTNPADQISNTADDPGSTDDSPLSTAGQAKVETIIEYGKSKLGCKYVYGAEGPNTFDCSGFTQTAFAQAGVKLSRSAYSVGYGAAGDKIAYAGLVRGDIVCFNTISDSDLSDHVGIYLGDGKFIHASSGKGQVVISDMSSGYYNRVFSWGKRFIH